jgi:molybdopterin/thiamine biosynthesis adenylyltransferase
MSSERHNRQSFLGSDIARICRNTRIAVAGLGGGGSHTVQQLAHVGFRDFLLVDPDTIEETNLNRLVGGTAEDVRVALPKAEIARRLALSIQPGARVEVRQKKWQEVADELHEVDLIFGNLDDLSSRLQLEVLARRHLIPYIDIGLGVVTISPQPPRMSGQVMISLPGHPCLRCLGVIDDGALTEEAQRYGDAGHRPQVVWANGLLASTAVGCALEILTGWTSRERVTLLYSYDGNLSTVTPDTRLEFVSSDECPHFPPNQVGPPVFHPIH